MFHEISLTSILSVIKTGLQSNCDISYSRGVVNQMYIVKNAKDLLKNTESRYISSCNIILLNYYYSIYYYSPLTSKNQINRIGPVVFLKI